MNLAEEMLEHMKTHKPFNELELTIYHNLFLDFCILGGMPAVVREYITKGTFEGSLDIQRQLLADYEEDIHSGIKLSGGNIGYEQNIYTFPYFCTFLLKVSA